ncbi:CARDB domain-containing protein [Rhodopirellula sp. MGV]|uniref:CARDB domain-containing protein n=1 Tax=Rhodopirellula sp. MGV TaxID=2023130 RepID=UPI0013045395|nr:CARDB domain-containing protein [Rhodopirellula sp. MGV]
MARKRSGLQRQSGLANELRQKKRVRTARLARKLFSKRQLRTPFEQLEDRRVLAAIHWDGGGDNSSWHDPLNWDSDQVPAVTDDVTIEDVADDLSINILANVEVASISTTERLHVVGSELKTTSLIADELHLENASLIGQAGMPVSATIQRLLTVEQSASDFMVLGNLHVTGDLLLAQPTRIVANGADAQLTVDGDANLEDAQVSVTAGGVVAMPNVQTYWFHTDGNGQTRTFSVDGAGSRLDFSGLQIISGGRNYNSHLNFVVTDGGVIDLSGVASVVDPAEGNVDFRSIKFQATGADSKINLPSLVSIVDQESDDPTALIATSGGVINVPSLTHAQGTSFGLDGSSGLAIDSIRSLYESSVNISSSDVSLGSLIDATGTEFYVDGVALGLPQLTSLQNGGIHLVDGGQIDSPLLSEIDGADLSVTGGSSLTLPNVTRYAHAAESISKQRKWQVDGVGSKLILPHLETITGATTYGGTHLVRVTAGGAIELPVLRQVTDPREGNQSFRRFEMTADGTASRIEVGQLQSIIDQFASGAGQPSVVDASNGGVIDAANLRYLRGVKTTIDTTGDIATSGLVSITQSDLTIDQQPSLFESLTTIESTRLKLIQTQAELNQISRFEHNQLITDQAATIQLPSVTSINGSGFEAYGGTVISLDAFSEYRLSPLDVNEQRAWIADGAGSKIDLSNVEWIEGGDLYNTRINVAARDGGEIDLSSVQQVVDPLEGNTSFRQISFSAEGDASTIRLDQLVNVIDRDGNLVSSLAESNGGSVLTPALQTLVNATLMQDHAMGAPAVTESGQSVLSGGQETGMPEFAPTMSRQIVTWLGGDGDWTDPSMWDAGRVPSVHDAVELTSGTATIGSGDQTAYSINGSGALHLQAGSLTLWGESRLDGELSLDPGTTLALHGQNASLVADGTQVIDGANFSVTDGAELRFTKANSYSHLGASNVARNWIVQGSGSVLAFDALTEINGGEQYNTRLNLEARAGGQISLPMVSQIVDGSSGNTSLRSIKVLAIDAGSQIDLNSLVRFQDDSSDPSSLQTYSQLQALRGGEISLGSLTELIGVAVKRDSISQLPIESVETFDQSWLDVDSIDVELPLLEFADGASFQVQHGSLSLPALRQLTRGELRVGAGASVSVDVLEQIDGSNLIAERGAAISLPLVTHYDHSSTANSQTRRIEAKGFGSQVSLPSLQTITGATTYGSQLAISANDGGQVALPELTSIADPESGNRSFRGVHLIAVGYGSELQLPKLATFADVGESPISQNVVPAYSTLSVTGGATVQTGVLAELTGVQLISDRADAIDVSTVQTALNSSLELFGAGQVRFDSLIDAAGTAIRLNGIAGELPELTTIRGGELSIVSGATIEAPKLADIDSATLIASGGETISLPNVTTISHSSTAANQTMRLRAEGPGSRLDLSNVTSIRGGTHYNTNVAIEALSGGVVDLSNAVSLVDPSEGNLSFRRFEILSEGVGSLIDLASLTLVSDASSGSTSGANLWSSIIARYGGRIDISRASAEAAMLTGTRVVVIARGTVTGSFELDTDSVLTGDSNVQAAVISGGLIQPEPRLSISGPLQLLPTSVVELEISGTTPVDQYEQLSLSSVQFDGTVRTVKSGGFEPEFGDSFRVITFDSKTGTPAYEGLDFGSQILTPELTANALEFVAGFSSGPAIESIDVSDSAVNADGPFLVLNFNEAIDQSSLTTDDIILTGPGDIAVAIDSIEPFDPQPDQTSFTSFIVRPNRDDYVDGQYELVIGPNVLDVVGNPMNQDGDQTNGEPLDDQFATTLQWALPDLALSGGSLNLGQTAYQFGTQIDVAYQLGNAGTGTAGGSDWTDRIYLSHDQTLDGDDLSIGELLQTDVLTSGQQLSSDLTVTLPLDVSLQSGTYYLLLSLDDDQQISESDETNVVSSSAIELLFPPLVDLTPLALSGPVTLQPGQTSVFSWSVVNQGDIATDSTWFDQVQLRSVDQPDEVYFVGRVLHTTMTLVPGQSYQSMMTVDLPAIPDGNYLVELVTDWNDRLFEGPYEDNNVIQGTAITIDHADLKASDFVSPATAQSGETIALQWRLANQGTGTAHQWTQRLYLSADGNVSADDRLLDEFLVSDSLDAGQARQQTRDLLLPIDVQGTWNLLLQTDAGETVDVDLRTIEITLAPYADLTVENIELPNEITGDPAEVTVQWTVRNQGTGQGAVDHWTDTVIFSQNEILGDDDDWVAATIQHHSGIDAGQAITYRETILLPAATSGRFNVFVQTDSANEVFENGFEQNNTAVASNTIDVRRALPADLIVSDVVVPVDVDSGTTVDVTWTVQNIGPGITDRGDWYDKVYLATDAAGEHPVEGTETRFQHFGQLGAGGNYVRTGGLVIPHGISGEFFVIVHTAQSNAPYEFIFTGNNQTASPAITVTLSPTPDLTVTDLIVPATAQEGTLIDVQWTVLNDGLATATGGWIDRVYLQEAGNPNAPIIELGQYPFLDPIEPGIRYTRGESIRIPRQTTGVFRIFVDTNAGELLYEATATTNNTKSLPLTIDVNPRPDLQIESISVPERLDAGARLSPSFVVLNQGGRATEGTTWIDRVYLSLDTTVDQADLLIGEFDNGAALAPGERYNTLTDGIIVPLHYRGTVYVLVQTDALDDVDEWPGEDNNVFYEPVIVERDRLADLAVSDVLAPSQVVAGAVVPVRYTVTNLGESETIGETWLENVWLTRDKDRPHPGQGDYVLKSISHSGKLTPGAGYESEVLVTIPETLPSGTWYITPWVDPLDMIPEESLVADQNPDDPTNLDNNNYHSLAVQVLGSQPDLVVTDVDVPATTQAGETIHVEWTVSNLGLADAGPGGWLDRVYLSDRPDPKADDATTMLLAEVKREQPLAEGASYTVVVDVPLSPSASGQYIIVITDDDLPPQPQIDLGSIFGNLIPPQEQFFPVTEVFEDNNLTAVSAEVVATPANLKVVDFDLPSDARSGEEITFSYTVENIGTAPVWSGTKYWKDFVWLSSDPTFIRDRASFLGATVYAPDEILQPGDRYTVSMTTTLPPGTDGDYSLWVHLNANNDQSPFLFPYLARRLDEQFYPADEGENDLWVGHFDHWAFEDPSDNLARAVLPIEYREADLVVTQFDVPNDVTSGETVTLTYTVANQGDRATRIGSWSDRVFISRDDSLDNRDLQVGSTPHFGILEPGQSYTASINARIPDGIEGDFQLILFADSAAQIDRSGRLGDIGFRQVGIEFELPGSLAPWDLASSASRQSARGKVKEYQQEGNNIAAQTTSVTLAMPPDLQVETVTAPLRADRGQSIDVSYVVRNAGGNTVAAQDEWIDLIYLSRDTLLDLSGDIYLGSVEHQDGLAAGEAYSIETTVPLPADLLGPYYVFVITDPDRERFAGDVFEGGLERNNAAHPGTPLLIELPPPVDLEVQSVTVPQNSVTGEAVEFTWTVTNNSNETAEGHWSDSVYLSVDASWNLSDVPVGRVEFEGTLEPGESYTSTLQTWMLSVTPGAYRAIVRTDIFNQVFEADLEGNNTTASPSTMQVTAPRLTLDVPYPTTLLPSQQRLFAVDVPPEQTLRVTVIADDDSSQEVYLRSAVAPTTHQYDASSGGTLASATSAVVPSTIAGTYYVLLDNFAASEAGSSIRVLAELLPLAITDVRTDVGGDSRYVTTTIQGARFHEDAIVKLVRPGFAEYLPVTLNRVSASEIIATFDFDDAPHGLYDVQVINPDGQVAVLPYRFLIQRTIEPEVSVGIGGPRYVFAGDQGTYSVAIENLSNVDAPYVYYSVGIPELGINQNVYNLPYTHFTSNLRGGPEGSLHDLPWAELDSAVNVDGHWTAGGYLFDQAADRSAGFNFQVQTYPGLRELSDHAWEAFKAKLYEAVPLYAEQDLLAEGPSALDQLSPGLSLVWEVFGAVPDLLTQPLIPFQFHVVASATAMTRDEFIAHALAEAETLRSGILNDADADAALVNLAGDQDAWQDLYLAYLTESGRLRAEDVAPPARRDQELASLMATLTGGVMTGPGGDQVILAGTFDDFFANVRRWYGHDPSLTAPLADDLTQFDSDSLSFLGILRSANPVAELPIFDDYDLGLGANTHFQAMRVYVPWVPFGRRSDGIPSEYQINGITPNGEDIFFPLNLQGYYDQLGGVSGAASQTGPFTIETGGFVPAETPLPITVNFQNDPNALRETNEIRVVVPLDENVDPRSFRLGDLKISDLNIRMPDNRSLYQGEFEFADSLGYNVRVSAGVDLQSNTATWLIQAIDPLTGEVRTDGQNGLLPPNDAQGHGAGFVSYSVQIADQATSGATFTARARVLLDNAPADDAEPLTYAIDAQSPISTVNVTPLNNQHDFVVRWQSIDEPEGSGVKHVTIYVAEDGGDFKIWKRQQPGATGEEVFVGRVGHDYEFLALATDLAGNRETPPTGRSTADDGSRVALGTLPAVDTSTSNQLGQPATPRSTPSPNALFTVAENLIPSQVSPSRPSSFATVLQPFAAQQFAGGFANSANAVDSSGIGPMAIAEMPSGDFLVSGGASRNQLYLFSSEGGEADRVWAELDHPIFNLVFDHSERLWATTGGGPLLELDPSDGTVLAEYGDGLTMGLTVDPISGDLFVGSGSGVERFDPETKRFSHFSRDQDLRVGSLAFADDGTLYATRWPQRDAVVKFNALGRAETVLQFDTPIDSIAIGIKDTPLEGLMFVTHNRGIRGANSDNENSELTMVDLASLRQVPLASGGTRGDVVITSSDGNIYVSGSTSVDVLSPIQTPQIIATLPAEQTTTALPLGMIAVAFSEDMWVGDGMAVQSVINPGNYVIHSADGNDPVVTGVRYHDATRTAYVFVSGFQPGDQTLFVGGGIQSAGGFPMASGFEVHFKTVSEFSADVDITIVGTRLNRAEQTLTYDVTITNQGSYDLLLPMSLAFTSNGRLIEATPADDASSDAEGAGSLTWPIRFPAVFVCNRANRLRQRHCDGWCLAMR